MHWKSPRSASPHIAESCRESPAPGFNAASGRGRGSPRSVPPPLWGCHLSSHPEPTSCQLSRGLQLESRWLQTPAMRFAFGLQLLSAQEMDYTSSPYLSPSLSQVAGSQSQMKYVSVSIPPPPPAPLHLVLKQLLNNLPLLGCINHPDGLK